MRVAVLGDGLLGSCVADVLDIEPITRKQVDFSDVIALWHFCTRNEFDWVINCAGITPHSPDYRSSKVLEVNAYLPARIASWINSKHIHISTDCVFSGERGSYQENSVLDGYSAYAISKIWGENATFNEGSRALILRTSFVGLPDPKGRGLFAWASQQEKIDGYRNVYWSGLTTLEVANRIKWFIDNDIYEGLVHLHGERISKYELLTKSNEVFGWGAEITPVDEPINDKSLISFYPDYQTDKSLDQMLQELKEYADRK